MLPAGPLMKEHRIIERMIAVMRKKLDAIKKKRKADPAFIDTAVDFIRTYADRCHHGKEEDILFRELDKKKISDEHRRIMNALLAEHKMGRSTVKKLVEAKQRYVQKDANAVDDIIKNIETLVEFYPMHIEKEDKHFFLPCMDYFNDKEKDVMLKEMAEFDRSLIHEHYTRIVKNLE